ncbi:hypothetical protein [Salinibacter ruber]|uniref:hypothetical protein n=1 Tax=Salinibacter ruber TaxID=146919 RepID=UPI000E57DEDA|nr:hypothetical protein [Salinibacter ruber]
MWFFFDSRLYPAQQYQKLNTARTQPIQIPKHHDQKNWNAPSLTEHGGVEELTAIQDVPGEAEGPFSDDVCDALDGLDGGELFSEPGCS